MHINGWGIIEEFLAKNKMSQRDLALFLDITPSAVSQAKKGEMQFSLAQLILICEVLKMKDIDAGRLFTEAMNSRIKKSVTAQHHKRLPGKERSLTVYSHQKSKNNSGDQ